MEEMMARRIGLTLIGFFLFGCGPSEEDGHLYGYDTDYGIGGDSWIHSTSMINVGYYLAVAPNNPSANVRNLPFNT